MKTVNNRRRALAIAASGAMALALAACSPSDDDSSAADSGDEAAETSDSDDESGSDTSEEELTYVAIARTLSNPAFAIAKTGADDRIEELGGNIDLIWSGPDSADPQAQIQELQGYVQKEVDGIFVTPLDPSVCAEIDRTVEAGVPVVTFDSDCTGDTDRTSYVGSDNYAGGYAAGEQYAKAVEGQGPQRIAILTGNLGAVNLGERDDGFTDAIEDSGIDAEIVTTVSGNEDLNESVNAVESTLRGDETINGFYFDGPWPLLVEKSNLPLMTEKVEAGELTVVSFDTLQPMLQYVEDGLVDALVGQDYYGWGYQAITVLDGIVRDGASFDEQVYTEGQTVTQDGAGDTFTPEEMNQFWDDEVFPATPAEPKG